MDIPGEQIQKRIRNLRILGLLFLVVSVFIFYMDYTKEKFASKNDLVFISGPFQSYLRTQTTRYTDFTFRLENYNDVFEINGDYLKVLDLKNFKTIAPGELITIGIHPSAQKYLHTAHSPIFVYSIEGVQQVYLSVTDAIIIYNSLFVRIFSLSLFGCSLLCIIYYYRLRKLYR